MRPNRGPPHPRRSADGDGPYGAPVRCGTVGRRAGPAHAREVPRGWGPDRSDPRHRGCGACVPGEPQFHIRRESARLCSRDGRDRLHRAGALVGTRGSPRDRRHGEIAGARGALRARNSWARLDDRHRIAGKGGSGPPGVARRRRPRHRWWVRRRPAPAAPRHPGGSMVVRPGRPREDVVTWMTSKSFAPSSKNTVLPERKDRPCTGSLSWLAAWAWIHVRTPPETRLPRLAGGLPPSSSSATSTRSTEHCPFVSKTAGCTAVGPVMRKVRLRPPLSPPAAIEGQARSSSWAPSEKSMILAGHATFSCPIRRRIS